MKKVSFILAVVMLLCIPVSAFAADGDADRILTNNITFSISNGVANAYVEVLDASHDISVGARILDGKKCIKSWSDRNNGAVIINESVPVKKGRTYTLIVDVFVDGVAKVHEQRIAKS